MESFQLLGFHFAISVTCMTGAWTKPDFELLRQRKCKGTGGCVAQVTTSVGIHSQARAKTLFWTIMISTFKMRTALSRFLELNSFSFDFDFFSVILRSVIKMLGLIWLYSIINQQMWSDLWAVIEWQTWKWHYNNIIGHVLRGSNDWSSGEPTRSLFLSH